MRKLQRSAPIQCVEEAYAWYLSYFGAKSIMRRRLIKILPHSKSLSRLEAGWLVRDLAIPFSKPPPMYTARDKSPCTMLGSYWRLRSKALNNP